MKTQNGSSWTYPVAIAALLFSLAGSAFAGPVTQKNFDRLWGKYAVGFLEKPKMACVCFYGANEFRLGSLVRSGDSAYCYLPGFDSEGVLNSQSPCGGIAVPLAK